MSLLDTLKAKRNEILLIAAKHGARNVRIFGSALKKVQRPDSDIDLLVEMERGRSLIDLVELNDALEAVLQRHVDVVTDGGISPFMKDRIYEEAVPL
jgi:uncharacterized protein